MKACWKLLCLAAVALRVCAAQAADTVVGWGDNAAGQAQPPPGLSNVVGIAAGFLHSLALQSNGLVIGWGYNFFGQATAPAGLSNVTAIAAGHSHSLALRNNGTVVVWGNQAATTGLTNILAVAAGWEHSLALRQDRTVVSWGALTEVPAGLTNVVAIAAGDGHSLALRTDGTVTAWGSDAFGKTNVPFGLTNVLAIASGKDHNLALKSDGTVIGWGDDSSGQATVPPGLSNVVSISAGALHSLALKSDGTLAAWGDNTYNQSVVNTQGGFVAISGGGHHSLGLKGGPAPVIVLPPVGQSVDIGKDVVFRMAAVGAQPITLQWRRNGTNIPGATASSLALTNVQPATAGTYTVVAANFAGSVTSPPALLIPLATPPLVVQQPENQTIICGDPFIFPAVGDGAQPLSYQWWFNGMPIAGATAKDLAVNISNTNQAGLYSVVLTNAFGVKTSALAQLTVNIEPTFITSPLVATGKQGQPFNYTITALHAPSAFGAAALPPGLAIDSGSGLISGVPTVDGLFGPWMSAANSCASDVQALVLTILPSTPVITSPLDVSGIEETPFSYQIVATESPTSYGATGLPVGLTVNPTNGLISGKPIYSGEFFSTVFASNVWGIGAATLHFTFTNVPITGLSIANVTYRYSSPYLLDFEFSLRDNDDPSQGHAVVAPPRLLSVTCKEDDQPISASETAVIVQRGSTKLMKTYLVLDFTESIASLSNGDIDNDGLSDAVETMVSGAQDFVIQQPPDAQIGVYEFHREDVAPQKVLGLTTDREALTESIGGIWDNYVQWFPASSRCWDALVAAIAELGPTNRDEQHFLVFVSDGKDESSMATVANVITAATNNGVKIYCIGFGAEMDTATLQAITSETQGRLYTATNAADLAIQFAEIGKDLNGIYVLRWATLKRTATAFMPSFEVTYQGLTALSPTNPVFTTTNITPPATNPPPPVTNFIIGYFNPSQNTGSVTVGALRLVANAELKPRAVTLRAAYVPRYIRQLRIHYRPNWPCVATLQSAEPGDILSGWSLIETNDGSAGRWLQIVSPNPISLTNSIPFGALGNLVKFTLRDMVDATNAFSLFEVDNTIYTNTGGQRFVIENTNLFTTVYPPLPYGTPVPWLIAHGFTNNFPAAELTDSDGDGIPAWKEYQANTVPTDPNSRFIVRSLSQRFDWRYQVVFSSSVNRSYKVEASVDLITWETVQEDIPGNGGDITVVDERYLPGVSHLFYRVSVY